MHERTRPTSRCADLVSQGGNDRRRLRSAASSILNECGLWHADAVERRPAHVDNDCVRRAYARANSWDERARRMTWQPHRCCELEARWHRRFARAMTVHSMLSVALSCNPSVCRMPLQRAILVVSARRCAMTGIAEWLASIGLGEYAEPIPRKRHRPLGRSRSHGAGSQGPGRPAWASPQDAARDRRPSGRAAANTSNRHQAGVGGQRRAASTYSLVLRSGRLVGTFGPPRSGGLADRDGHLSPLRRRGCCPE